MNVRFLCPSCQTWTATSQIDGDTWTCAGCGVRLASTPSPSPTRGEEGITPLPPRGEGAGGGGELTTCRLCGNHELYIQKDFPQWLGMGILVLACGASAVTYAFYWIITTWIILLGSAAIDTILYLVMGSVTVCYRCQTQYRGFPPNTEHKPFELAVGEKYRQERIRREELEKST